MLSRKWRDTGFVVLLLSACLSAAALVPKSPGPIESEYYAKVEKAFIANIEEAERERKDRETERGSEQKGKDKHGAILWIL